MGLANLGILLIDRDAQLVRAWKEVFRNFAPVHAERDDFFSKPADAMVSPANSFGVMDGGLDLAIRDELGYAIQQAVQNVIIERHHGELPVGSAEIVATADTRWPLLVVAPTMRVPEDIRHSRNAYLAFRAALLCIERWNCDASTPIRSVVVPGLGTGIGKMEPRRCAAQMRIAYTEMTRPPRIPSSDEIHRTNRALLTAT